MLQLAIVVPQLSFLGMDQWTGLRGRDLIAHPFLPPFSTRDKGGYWSISPAGPSQFERAYIRGSNVLETYFITASGPSHPD